MTIGTKRKEQQLLVRAMKDEAFRQELLTNPKPLLEHELGGTLPQGVTIQVHEDTPTTVHLVLPPWPRRQHEVSDADLEQAASAPPKAQTCHNTQIVQTQCYCRNGV